MKVICPFCGATGEIADRLQSKPLRCRQCGTRFQPKPPAVDEFGAAISSAVDDSTEQLIDVDHLVSQAPTDLGVILDNGINVYQATAEKTAKGTRLGPLKFVLTTLAVLLNCFMLSIMIRSLADDLQLVNQVGDRQHAIVVKDGHPFIQSRTDALSSLGTTMIVFFLVGSLPLLGAYISHAKGRGLAEGYNLVTFFGPIGLIVGLCLPTNREGD